MNKVLGIDPGSLTWDFFALKGKQVILDISIPTKEVIEEPSRAITIIKSIKNLDLIVAPSGFGLPLKYVKDIIEKDRIKLKFNIQKHELKALKPNIDILTISLDESGHEEKTHTTLSMILGFGSAILIYFFIFLYGVQVMRGVIEEKTSRIIEVIVSD